MERSLNGFTLWSLSNHGTKSFKGLPLGSSGEGEEGLVIVSALANDRIYILVGQINFIFLDTGFLGIFFDSDTDINQTAAQYSGTQAALTLVCLVNNDGKLTTTELLHILLSKEEFLDRTNDNALLIVDSFRKTAGVLLIVNSFDQADLMLKAVDSILELTI